MPNISILSGGAAQALVKALEPEFADESGYGIDGTFGAVGAMRAKLSSGPAPDVVILTAAIIAELADCGIVLRDTVADLGDVETAIAIRAGDPMPAVGDAASLREALLAADAIYFPDPKLATAGIHFAGVIEKLGIGGAVAPRLRPFPNGTTAMAALAQASEARPIGCTQVTEIMATAGAALVAVLPQGLDLSTRYTAGVVAGSPNQAKARDMVTLLASEARLDARRRAGFV
jgi:molybdate transport system substrate-binding protein